ncbi:MAG: TetR/AcrR family transcriptional regulator [Bacteroidetes bacterium]|nr:TetR/AcrR family transcriptional regulator [Bacteroidota bacterium]MCH8246861.1 TetR/AcrR family transcriptional regulator [Bacteroidota bacterium]
MGQESKNGLQRRILDTARRLLISDGYARLSMRKIAREIGYSATTIYLHFKNKDQLVHALIEEGVSRLHRRLLSRSNQNGEGVRKRLRNLCSEYVVFGLDNPEYYEIMYMLHPENLARYPADKYRRARKNLELLASVYQEGVDGNVFQRLDPMLAASIIWSHMHGVVSLILSERFDARLDKDRVIGESIERVIRGFEPEHRIRSTV